MLTGRVPFSSDSEYDLMKMQIENAPPPPRVFSNQIPQPVEQAIMRALAKRSEARFQGAGEFRDVLLSAIGMPVAPVAHTPMIGTVPVASASGVPSPAPIPAQLIAQYPIAEQPKETRLAGGDSAAVPGDQIGRLDWLAGRVPAAVYGSFQTSVPSAPPIAKSNVKLLIGVAAVVIVAIIGALIFLLTSGAKTGDSPAATPSAKPIQSATPPTSPSASQPPAASGGVSQPTTPAQVPIQPPKSAPIDPKEFFSEGAKTDKSRRD